MGDLLVGGASLSSLIVLGATGSIGRQTIEVAQRIGMPVHTIAARTASDGLLELAAELPDARVCVVDRQHREDEFRAALGNRLHFGKGAVTEAAAHPGAIVVNGIVGAAGLAPSLAALYAGNRLALANKESLVAGGPLIAQALANGEGELIPVDSEHSAIWQCLVGEDVDSVRRVILTASGGPFRGFSVDQLADVTVGQALAHPTWDMGPRISIDSATLMNKAFEVVEAHYLFGFAYDQIDVVIHPQSVVHSFVEFTDGVVKAEVGSPDMRKPIQYAITAPQRTATELPPFAPADMSLSFEAPDRDAFPCLDLGYEAGQRGGTATAVLNAADEVAVGAFLDGMISFPDIATVVGGALDAHQAFMPSGIDALREVDSEARSKATEACGRISR
ncbi:MAG: 1-deoxy-D-xylulose-5-phosphate reductoisomerase [Acidimicrobiia bacterium]